mgnify:CR=1 FL=1
MGKISVDDLQEGMVLLADVKSGSQILLAQGALLTDKSISVFKSWGVVSVEIDGVTEQQLKSKELKKVSPKKLEEMEKNTIMKSKTNGNSKISDRLLSAKKVFDGFPDDWNFFGKVSDKMDRLKQLGSKEGMIDALYVADSAAMKKALKSAFPSHFFD